MPFWSAGALQLIRAHVGDMRLLWLGCYTWKYFRASTLGNSVHQLAQCVLEGGVVDRIPPLRHPSSPSTLSCRHGCGRNQSPSGRASGR